MFDAGIAWGIPLCDGLDILAGSSPAPHSVHNRLQRSPGQEEGHRDGNLLAMLYCLVVGDNDKFHGEKCPPLMPSCPIYPHCCHSAILILKLNAIRGLLKRILRYLSGQLQEL